LDVPSPLSGRLVVTPPRIAATGNGNVGTDFTAIGAAVGARELAIVRERYPDAELGAPAQARLSGAAYLLETTIGEWRQMRTDDPIGAIILPHDSVTLTLRLLRLAPPSVLGSVTFHNQARLTLNRPAIRLLDGKFERLVLDLITGSRH
jgi:hypothetical protein